jgi:replication factor A1
VLTIPPSSQVYLYIYKGYDLSTPAQPDYVSSFTYADVIGVVTILSNVSSMRLRTRQKESLKRTVTICDARSVARKLYS